MTNSYTFGGSLVHRLTASIARDEGNSDCHVYKAVKSAEERGEGGGGGGEGSTDQRGCPRNCAHNFLLLKRTTTSPESKVIHVISLVKMPAYSTDKLQTLSGTCCTFRGSISWVLLPSLPLCLLPGQSDAGAGIANYKNQNRFCFFKPIFVAHWHYLTKIKIITHSGICSPFDQGERAKRASLRYRGGSGGTGQLTLFVP